MSRLRKPRDANPIPLDFLRSMATIHKKSAESGVAREQPACSLVSGYRCSGA
jgi:hypothetical protein